MVSQCLPTERRWPGVRCERCIKYNYVCSANRSKEDELRESEPHSGGQAPSEQSRSKPISQLYALEYLPSESEAESHSIDELGYLGELLVVLNNIGYDSCDVEDEFKHEADHICDVNKTLETLWQRTFDDSVQRVEELLDGNQSWEAELLYERILAYLEPCWGVSCVRPVMDMLMAKLIDLYCQRGEFWAAIKMHERLNKLSHKSNTFDSEQLSDLYHKFAEYETELLQNYMNANILTPMYKSSILSILPVSHRAVSARAMNTPGFSAFNSHANQRPLNIWHQDVLHSAARHGKYESILDIVKLGISTTASSDIFGRSPLHWAIGSGCLKTVNALINQNFDINEQDANLYTPLHTAVLEGNLEILWRLINASADLSLENFIGDTPLNCAINASNFQAAHALLQNIDEALETDYEGDTLLHSVFHFINDNVHIHDKKSLIKQLLKKGADVCAKNNKGHTPLYYVIKDCDISTDDEDGGREIINLLIAKGANMTDTNNDGRAPLHWALMSRNGKNAHPSIFEFLIQRGAQVDAKDKEGNTAMHLAAENGRADLVSMLLKHHALGSAANYNYETPYDVAIKKTHFDVISMLAPHQYALF